jgi:hypothetical protein
MPTEDAKDRVDRELSELLEEVRIALPGAEVLFAFLLGVAFTERVKELSSTVRAVYFATLLLTAAATALLIAPTAYHRIRFREGDKERLLVSATWTAIASLVLMLRAVAGAVRVVDDLLYAPTTSPTSHRFLTVAGASERVCRGLSQSRSEEDARCDLVHVSAAPMRHRHVRLGPVHLVTERSGC